MQLIIKAPVPVADVPRNSYVVEIQSMQGDADGYRDFIVGPFQKGQDETPLQSLLETLKRMDERFPNGMGGYDTYRDVLGHLQWFGTEEISVESLREHYPELLTQHGVETHQELINMSENHYSEWHGDAMTDYQRDEKLTKYGVIYYDEAGTNYDVEVIW